MEKDKKDLSDLPQELHNETGELSLAIDETMLVEDGQPALSVRVWDADTVFLIRWINHSSKDSLEKINQLQIILDSRFMSGTLIQCNSSAYFGECPDIIASNWMRLTRILLRAGFDYRRVVVKFVKVYCSKDLGLSATDEQFYDAVKIEDEMQDEFETFFMKHLGGSNNLRSTEQVNFAHLDPGIRKATYETLKKQGLWHDESGRVRAQS